jgi:hypothetical protein
MTRHTRRAPAPLLAALALLAAPAVGRTADSWRYVVPPPGNAHEHPPPRAVILSPQKPAVLKEIVHYRGSTQRYGQVTYGGPASVPVAVVLDEIAADEADLYVDATRSRTIGPKDRVSRAKVAWRLKLTALVAGDGAESAERTVVFRLARSGRTLSFATCGYLEGSVRLGDRAVAVRRQDGDGNGLFTDPQDRLWLDLDGDGRWDPLDEQFLYAPILTLAGARYAVHSDPFGRRLALEKVEGTGTIRLTIRPPALAEKVEEVSATLMGRDGSVCTLRGRAAEAVLPVDDYRLSALSVTVADPHGGPSWSFTFADGDGRRPYRWHTLGRDSRLALDPIGRLELVAVVDEEERRCRPGDRLAVRPRLYTGDGLLICSAGRGAAGEGSGAELVLAAADGRVLDVGGSGFA